MSKEKNKTPGKHKNVQKETTVSSAAAKPVTDHLVQDTIVGHIQDVTTSKTRPEIITIKLLRPEDMLSIELRFKNFELQDIQTGKAKQKILVKKADPALMMVVFEPQSIFEECGKEDDNSKTLPAMPARMMCSGNSRLVFAISAKQLSLDVKELLNWEQFKLVVNDRAKSATNSQKKGWIPFC